MSGGVDSSVSAYLLKSQGYEVHAVYMHNWDAHQDTQGRACTSDKDWMDVQAVCRHMNIPPENVHLVDFVKEYWIDVFEPALRDYALGKTPNPDIACNRYIKFGKLFERFRDQADWVATGHYARLSEDRAANPWLLKAADPSKDQTYFLHQVAPSTLRRTMFPVGALSKSRVKEIAREIGLSTASKKESMGICFVGKKTIFGEFLESFVPQQPGRLVTLSGAVKGHHRGLGYFTIGQGARIPGQSAKWYVAKKDARSNDVTVVRGWGHPALYARRATVAEWNWIPSVPAVLRGVSGPGSASGSAPGSGSGQQPSLRAHAAHRYHEPLVGCTIHPNPSPSPPDPGSTDSYIVEFDQPQRGVAEGQWIVVYDGERCLGGGTVTQVGESEFERSGGYEAGLNESID
ncbi:hypothetical protein HDU93_006390 [Gonapodya sp. JEL0774]|nr:hypothetical protein HDU93_006390 [Gonapodya sp. JEL0774]